MTVNEGLKKGSHTWERPKVEKRKTIWEGVLSRRGSVKGSLQTCIGYLRYSTRDHNSWKHKRKWQSGGGELYYRQVQREPKVWWFYSEYRGSHWKMARQMEYLVRILNIYLTVPLWAVTSGKFVTLVVKIALKSLDIVDIISTHMYLKKANIHKDRNHISICNSMTFVCVVKGREDKCTCRLLWTGREENMAGSVWHCTGTT